MGEGCQILLGLGQLGLDPGQLAGLGGGSVGGAMLRQPSDAAWDEHVGLVLFEQLPDLTTNPHHHAAEFIGPVKCPVDFIPQFTVEPADFGELVRGQAFQVPLPLLTLRLVIIDDQFLADSLGNVRDLASAQEFLPSLASEAEGVGPGIEAVEGWRRG